MRERSTTSYNLKPTTVGSAAAEGEPLPTRSAITRRDCRALFGPVSSSRGRSPSPSSHRTGLVGLTSGSSGRRGRRTQSLDTDVGLLPAAIPVRVSTALER